MLKAKGPMAVMLVMGGLGLARGETSAPLYIGNQNPFVLIYGVPKPESGALTPKNKLNAAFIYNVSNNALYQDAENGESIIWDGETATYTMKLRYGVSDWLEVGLDLPYVQHGGGYLDSTIRKFHSTLGYSNGRQKEFEKNQIHFLVADQGDVLYETLESSQGLGDIRLTAGVPLLASGLSDGRHLAARSVLKLPTGESEDLLGSGGTDVSLGLAYSDTRLLASMNIALGANVGAVYLGNSDVLAGKQNHLVGYGGASMNWRARNWLALNLQLDLQSAAYDSELIQLGSSLQLLAGAALRLPGDVMLDVGISEQLTTDATPDVGFYLMLGHLF
ncbi:DUF3187 family protein [Pontiella sp.]|uniref:DUF3187 family protein n=1 Tax=Pontiella sp. TaxID=2837462 RepID=UPI003564B80E